MPEDLPKIRESKHDKFLRLMTNRLGRTLEEFRMLSQLASANYENTDDEAREVILHLDQGLKRVAAAFGVTYKSHLVAPNARSTNKMLGAINEVDVARAISMIQSKDYDKAIKQLRDALNQEAR